MKILEHDINLIKLIDKQVSSLIDRGASDAAIVDSMIEFIPDVRCLIESVEPQELKLYIDSNQGFGYFIGVLSCE